MSSEEMLGRAYREATRPSSRSKCPPSGQLVDFASEPDSDKGIADHLGECSSCAEEYLALRGVAPSPLRTVGFRSSSAWPLAMAALLILSIGLGALSWSLLERNRALIQQAASRPVTAATPEPAPITATEAPSALPPRPNVAVIDLLPVTAVVRGGNDQAPAAPKGTDLTLILNLEAGVPRFPDYGVEIVTAAGETVWKGDGLQRSPHDAFTLHLPRGFLPPDRYELRLHGLRGERSIPIERYALDLRAGSR